MKTPDLIVRIPEPCHEDWNSMSPDAKGKFCNSCCKPVFDFSTKTDEEIKRILLEYKEQKVCGHFKKTQVDRPLNIKVNLNDLPRNMSFSKAFVIAVFLVFGSFLFSCKDEQGHTLGDIGFEIPKTDELSDERHTLGTPIIQIPDSLQTLIAEDAIALDEKFSESMMTGDVTVVEEYVDGALKVERNQGEETPMDTVNLDEVPIVDYMEAFMDGSTMTGLVSVTVTDDCFGHPFTNDSIRNEPQPYDVNTASVTKDLHVFPNPSNGEFTIGYIVQKRSYVNLTIYSMNGASMGTVVDIARQYEGNYQIPVNLDELPNGIYLVTLIIGDKKSVERLVIER